MTSNTENAEEIEREVADMGKSWPPLQAGLFDASVEKLQSVKAEFDKFMNGLHWD